MLALGLGLDLPRLEAASGGAAPPFDPLALGWIYYYDLLTASSMWADPARSVPANVTDPVNVLDDLTGNGNAIAMNTVGLQPTRGASGLFFDGGDKIVRADTLVSGVAVPSTPQPVTLWCVVDIQANTSTVFDNGSGATRILIQRTAASTTLNGFAGTALTRTGVPDLATRRAILFEVNGASSSLYVNNVLQGTAATAGANTLGGGINLGGNVSAFLITGTGPGQGLGAFGGRAGILTSQQRADLQAYAVSRFGLV